MSKIKLTPMFEQYLQIKEEYPDALLFYRMGDFYELFFDDAETAARELQITLTSRNPNAETKIPMCGVPHHAAENYLAQLLDKGFKVAVCDQVEDPRQAKGLVKREVTRVLTPGTVTEDANLTAKTHNYLCALYWNADKGQGGLAWVDFSTGEWSGLHSKKEAELWQWAVKQAPRELLLPRESRVPAQYNELSSQVTWLPVRPHFDADTGAKRILDVQGAAELKTLDLHTKPELVRCCGALLAYLQETQKQDFSHLWEFKPVNLSRHLLLDEVTERNLEIFRTLAGKKGKGTLRHVVDRTLTPMGGRLLESRLRRPWRDMRQVERTQAVVRHFFDNDELRASLRSALDTVYDLERLSTRIFLGRTTPRDFISMRQSVASLPNLVALLCDAGELPAELARVVRHWDSLEDLTELLERSLVDNPPPVITDGGLFKTGYHDQLDEFIELTEHGEATIQQLLEQEREKNDIPKLKLGFNKVFGYYFEVSKAYKGQVPEHFVRRQTLVNSERYITPDLKDLEDRMLSASEDRKGLEYRLFQELREILAQARPRFMFMAGALAALDYWQGLAEAARVNDWSRPVLQDSLEMRIEGGRHPVVEDAVGANYIPNDVHVDEARRILLITGPNMAGKSTVLRQVAIITILAQIGSFVPAKKAHVGLADRVFSRVGASDNLAQGQSTFMVEMTETARILRQATRRSLVILDEIGRGTSTFDGLALAWAVVEELSRRARGGIRTLFATHYHELTALEGRIDGLRNMNIAVKEWKGDIVFLRRLVPGPADRSYGIEVARLAGVPQPVVQRARELLADLEKKSQGNRIPGMGAPASSQSLLPGMAPVEKATAAPCPEEHPLLDELRDLDVDGLTPIQALTVLNGWKQRLKDGE